MTRRVRHRGEEARSFLHVTSAKCMCFRHRAYAAVRRPTVFCRKRHSRRLSTYFPHDNVGGCCVHVVEAGRVATGCAASSARLAFCGHVFSVSSRTHARHRYIDATTNDLEWSSGVCCCPLASHRCSGLGWRFSVTARLCFFLPPRYACRLSTQVVPVSTHAGTPFRPRAVTHRPLASAITQRPSRPRTT